MPAVLVEAAVIVHRAEERRARSPRHQRRAAEALAAGVRSYCDSEAARRATAAPPSP
jgi:N-acetylmuramoyl-L-alanine amidase